MIKSKADARKVIDSLGDRQMIVLLPNGYYGNLRVYINRDGCREFWNGEVGPIGEDDMDTIVNMLYKYRKAYNEATKEFDTARVYY